MNARYVRYARVHGNTPERQLEADQERFPGGSMCGFILWMTAAWRTFSASYNCHDYSQVTLRLGFTECHRLFNEFLSVYEVKYQ